MEENNKCDTVEEPDSLNRLNHMNKSPGDATMGKHDSNGEVDVVKNSARVLKVKNDD
jgi:hypothetical protein